MQSTPYKSFRVLLIWVSALTIALGFMESAVVVYLREIYYPQGFDFPLQPMDIHLAITEIIREAATVVILFAIGNIAGRHFSEKFAWFLFSFAVWDLFYYVFLKALLNWPASFMTWDVLFLIPVTWTGPVITPVIVSFTMILMAAIIFYFSYTDTGEKKIIIKLREWLLLISGSIVLILGFTWDYLVFLIHSMKIRKEMTGNAPTPLSDLLYQYVPDHFNWLLYAAGEGIILLGITFFFKRCRKEYKHEKKP